MLRWDGKVLLGELFRGLERSILHERTIYQQLLRSDTYQRTKIVLLWWKISEPGGFYRVRRRSKCNHLSNIKRTRLRFAYQNVTFNR